MAYSIFALILDLVGDLTKKKNDASFGPLATVVNRNLVQLQERERDSYREDREATTGTPHEHNALMFYVELIF